MSMQPPARIALLLSLSLFVFACASTAPVIETIHAPPDARSHVPDGVEVDYGTPFPTAGKHSLRWAETGFYTEPQPPPRLVHALEHGNIVIYYDDPGEEALKRLKAWSDEFQGQWDGIVVVPDPTLGRSVVLTAWEHRLVLAKFDDLVAGEFIDAFRGRGPEGRTR